MIKITDRAIQKIIEISSKENIEPIVRIGIAGGGCAGYNHIVDFEKENKIKNTDHVIECSNNVKIIIDIVSAAYLEGTEVDYKNSLMESGFKFSNEKYKNTCGCGSSFSL